MEVQVIFRQKINEKRGENQRGQWVMTSFLTETTDKYVKNIVFEAFGENLNTIIKNLHIGDNIKVSFEIESREYDGRYYTQARAYRIEMAQATQQEINNFYSQIPQQQIPQQQVPQPTPHTQEVYKYMQPPQPLQQQSQPPTLPSMPQDEDDLPF